MADSIKKVKTLADADIDKAYVIESVNNTGAALRRLLDLGIVPGTRVIPVFASPAKNPIAYLIRGTVIALRTEDSKFITVV